MDAADWKRQLLLLKAQTSFLLNLGQIIAESLHISFRVLLSGTTF